MSKRISKKEKPVVFGVKKPIYFQIVWAKVKGFCYWPAQIYPIEHVAEELHEEIIRNQVSNAILVKFFQTGEFAWIKNDPAFLLPYRCDNIDKLKKGRGLGKISVKDAEEEEKKLAEARGENWDEQPEAAPEEPPAIIGSTELPEHHGQDLAIHSDVSDDEEDEEEKEAATKKKKKKKNTKRAKTPSELAKERAKRLEANKKRMETLAAKQKKSKRASDLKEEPDDEAQGILSDDDFGDQEESTKDGDYQPEASKGKKKRARASKAGTSSSSAKRQKAKKNQDAAEAKRREKERRQNEKKRRKQERDEIRRRRKEQMLERLKVARQKVAEGQLQECSDEKLAALLQTLKEAATKRNHPKTMVYLLIIQTLRFRIQSCTDLLKVVSSMMKLTADNNHGYGPEEAVEIAQTAKETILALKRNRILETGALQK